MENIAPYSLWVGHARDGHEFREIFDRGIGAIVQLAFEEPPIPVPRELIYCRFPLLDGEGNSRMTLKAAVATLVELLRGDIATLVCCGAGMSRAPLIATAAISRIDCLSLEEAIRRVTAGRPADIAAALATDLAAVLETK